MFDEIMEKLRENAPYVVIGAVAGFLLRDAIDEMIENNPPEEEIEAYHVNSGGR